MGTPSATPYHLLSSAMDSGLLKKYAPHLIDHDLDPLSDTVHDGLDKDILNHPNYPGPWRDAYEGFWTIIATIVIELSPTLDKKMPNFLAQMATKPELGEAPVDCWKIQKFKTFRRFSECQKCHLLSCAYHCLFNRKSSSLKYSVCGCSTPKKCSASKSVFSISGHHYHFFISWASF